MCFSRTESSHASRLTVTRRRARASDADSRTLRIRGLCRRPRRSQRCQRCQRAAGGVARSSSQLAASNSVRSVPAGASADPDSSLGRRSRSSSTQRLPPRHPIAQHSITHHHHHHHHHRQITDLPAILGPVPWAGAGRALAAPRRMQGELRACASGASEPASQRDAVWGAGVEPWVRWADGGHVSRARRDWRGRAPAFDASVKLACI